MGKRKERRFAAMTNAGRRVKLDLHVEPSGDLGGSSAHDEVGVDTDSKHHAGLPNSPSSSAKRFLLGYLSIGLQPENPLLLLGQYSDDELEDGSAKTLDNAAAENSSPNNKDEVNVLHGEASVDVEVSTVEVQDEIDKDSASINYQNPEGADKRESDAMASRDLCKGLEMEQVSTSGTSDVQLLGDVGSGWQIVTHEESNQYYYWNTETGETSWEIPGVLAQASALGGNHKTPSVSETTEDVSVNTQEPSLSSGVTLENLSAATSVERLHPVVWNGVKNDAQNGANLGNDVMDWGSLNDTLEDANCESQIDLSSSLIKQSETLLERLKSVGSKGELQSLDCFSRCILEVEIRLSDIRTLSSFGSSLHEFWVHSQRQLKQLEDVINVEIYKIAESAVLDGKLRESMVHESKAYSAGNMVLFPISENTSVTPVVNTAPNMHVESSSGEQVNGAARPNELIPKHDSNSVEDVDMDVEDSTSAGNAAIADESVLKEFAVPKQSIQPIQPAEHTSVESHYAFAAPPPPDEECIPPPPPDSEQIPPPPPDEPTEPVYPPPPSYPETVPPAPYAEQYNMSYQNSVFEYYGHAATDVQNSNFYGHAEGCQVAVPQAPIYYSAVSNHYTETSHIAANPVAPVAYYELQNGVPPAPGTSITESSQFWESTSASYGTLALERVGSVKVGCDKLTTEKDSGFSVGGGIDRTSVKTLPTTATIQAPAAVPAKDTVEVASTDAVSVSATSMVTKVQSKVARSKKRTFAVAPSLRSSKKVSSLVNKWKAAKEELLEYEEEPENAYEMLGRKRQKEIEEWHAQQIASGEAKDNANFQPLGGDWRERVKRRRAQQASEATRTSSEECNDENQQQQRQTDLTEHSKDLPSGWQAYWDESSKQVYYGNVVTSETTWIRPTK